DSHAQFLNPPEHIYTWLERDSLLNRVYLPAEIPASGEGWTVEKIVAVEARCLPEQWKDEVNWLLGLAKADPRIAGVVAYTPLENHNFHAVLEILADLPQVCGVRRSIVDEKQGFAAQEHFIDAVHNLPDYDFTFDIACTTAQTDDVEALVRNAPDTKFVVDNLLRPRFETAEFNIWEKQMQRLALFENVHCKVATGMVRSQQGQAWNAEVIQPFVERLLRIFGTKRLMFGGDFPVVVASDAGYGVWVDVVLGMLSEAEQQQVFYDNAATFYGLD
ncbi:MAG: amidohydrolase family protein, partial [Chloroflexota bacterium]